MDTFLSPNLAIEGPARTGKTQILVKRAVHLLQTEPTDSILVLCSNYYRKSRFLEDVQEHLTGCYPQLPVTTYSALVRNTIFLFWPTVEAMITAKTRRHEGAVIFPELSGFEASEYILRQLIRRLKQRNPDVFQAFSGSERSLIMQLIRRIRLRSENRLERRDMRYRSEQIGEVCVQEVEDVLNAFDRWSSELRVLDNSRQIDVFHTLIEHEPQVEDYFKQRIRHLIVDDLDETIPAQQHLVKWLAPNLETFAIVADIDGGTRRGYLNAYPYDWEGLKRLKPDMQTLHLERLDVTAKAARQLLTNWLEPEQAQVLPAGQTIQWRPPAFNRMEMLQQMVTDIVQMLKMTLPGDSAEPRRITPGDIVIVMPRVDALARLQIENLLKRRGIPLQILTGTHRASDNPVCRNLLLLIQLANHLEWQMPLSAVELKGILRHGLKLHQLDPEGTETLIQHYRQGFTTEGMVCLPTGEHLTPEAYERYHTLLLWLEQHRHQPIDEQFYSAFSHVISPWLTADDELADIQQLVRSFYLEKIALAFIGEHPEASTLAAREWLIQMKTGIVSDTPNKPREVDSEAIVLGTPQKIIDVEIERPMQLWLDMSSREWSRTDNAPLYNAWVHSVNWDGDTTQASDEFNQRLMRTRAAHITRTLLLYAGERVLLYASELDDQGLPQTGMFHQVMRLPHSTESKTIERATLRDDQAAILDYQDGPMAITAVPGAGKTFVNVELILELIQRGIAPDQILVLTYMDSAAKTMLSRLKRKLGNHQAALPVVSTIHSLAMRIITESDHGLYLGLNTDTLQIIDEIEERDTIQAITRMFEHGENYFAKADTALQGIRLAKTYRLTPHDLARRCQQKGFMSERMLQFIQVYEAYHRTLYQQGKLDFTDLIVKAIELLEHYPEIRAKYQERFRVIIEDEAQDSSLLLQRFIDLLQQGHGNLVRTGDTNQSITTTFSTADTSVFRNFIQHCHDQGAVVMMNRSSRCAKPVMDLANRFIVWATQDDLLRHAFQPVTMIPVNEHNPELLQAIQTFSADTQQEEGEVIARHIQQFQAEYPDKSIAILTRGNKEVLALADTLHTHGIKVISYTDHPNLNPVFLFIIRLLQLLEDPFNREALGVICQMMKEMQLLSLSASEEEHLLQQNLFSLNPHTLENTSVLQFYYNMQDLVRYAFGYDICRLIVRLTDMFFRDPAHRSVGYLCALKAQQWVEQSSHAGEHGLSPLEFVNREFGQCLQRNRLPFKILQDVMTQTVSHQTQFVQIMTLHKSKGQEFDLVFIPGLTEKKFPSLPGSVAWKEGDKLELELERVRSEGKQDVPAMMEAKKLQKVEEEARLLYVGITRARQGLVLSHPQTGRSPWGKPETYAPSRYFTAIEELLTTATPTPVTRDA